MPCWLPWGRVPGWDRLQAGALWAPRGALGEFSAPRAGSGSARGAVCGNVEPLFLKETALVPGSFPVTRFKKQWRDGTDAPERVRF